MEAYTFGRFSRAGNTYHSFTWKTVRASFFDILEGKTTPDFSKGAQPLHYYFPKVDEGYR